MKRPRRGRADLPRFSVRLNDDPSLYDGAYWSAECNGFSLGTGRTKADAERIILKYKQTLREKGSRP